MHCLFAMQKCFCVLQPHCCFWELAILSQKGHSSFCGLTQPTPADTFLLRKKYPKAYQRGSVLFDISSGGSLPHSHSVTFPLVYHESLVLSWGCREGAAPPSAGNPKTRRFLVYLCLLSLHKKVGAVWSAQLHKVEGLLKLWFEVECRDNVLASVPNDTFAKTKVSL